MRCFHVPALASAVLLAGLAPAAPEADKPADAKEAKDKLVVVGSLVGVVESVGESTGDLTIKVTLRYLQPNPGAQAEYLRQQQNIIQRQQAILRTRNPAQRQQQLNQLYLAAMQLQRAGGNLFTVKEVQKDVELRLADEARVRTLAPPEQFDDKGNVKKWTREELKELKGPDPRVPGYKADRDSIEKGRTVLVQLARAPQEPAKKGKDKKPAKDKEADKPLVSVVLVGAEVRAR
jgi:hypothetical protein